MPQDYIHDLTKNGLPESVGSKARYLRDLIDSGYPVPRTRVCVWDAYSEYKNDNPYILEIIQQELARKIDNQKIYAVRSSANIEDNIDHSFAGQFKSFLNVRGKKGVLEAMEEIWQTAHSPEVKSYMDMAEVSEHDLLMAVILQEMISPVVSGVAFSKNPITGLDEIIVEAVQGSGTSIVQDGITPERWINKWGQWISKPEHETIDIEIISQVANQTKSIAKFFGRPVDLEWVFDGNKLYWLQLREISSLSGVNIYSNKIAKEMLPGIIKPLIWSVNVPLVNGAWVRLFTELIGPNELDPLSLAKSFYYRAYFNMSVIGDVLEMTGFPRETLELLIGVEVTGPERPKFKPSGKTYRLLPRLLWFVIKKLSISSEIKHFYRQMKRDYRSIPVDKINQMDEKELFEQIETLFVMTQETAYYTINTMLLMQVYNNLLKNRLTKQGIDYESFDMTHNFDELKEMDPITHLNRLAAIYQELPPIQQAAIKEANFDEFIQLQGINDLQQGVHHFIEQFGHLSDSGNDFSQTPWSENPDVVLSMLLNEVKADAKSSKQIKIEDINLSIGGRLFLGVLYRRARQYLLYREQVGSLFTFGFGLFRKYFLSLGEQFFKRELISAPNDIFYLTFDEIRIGVNKLAEKMNYVNIVESRKVELENYRDITPPTTIYGDQPIPLEDSVGNVLEGTPTSRGYYRGPAKIVRGISDIEVVSAGDVLVVPYSDVGWTPMFTKAGAIVAESGGILSHSSIVAREYGIPAVVSVPGACKLLQKKLVTVDGFQGRVIIHD